MNGIEPSRKRNYLKDFIRLFSARETYDSLQWDDYDVSKVRAEIAIAYAFGYLVLLVVIWLYKSTHGLPKSATEVLTTAGNNLDYWFLFAVIVISNIRVACGSLYGLSPEFEKDYLAQSADGSPIRLFKMYAFLKFLMLVTIIRSFFSHDTNQQLLLVILFFVESYLIVRFDVRNRAVLFKGKSSEVFRGNVAIVFCDVTLLLISFAMLANEIVHGLTGENLQAAGWLVSRASPFVFILFFIELMLVYRRSMVRGLCIWVKILSVKEPEAASVAKADMADEA